jgi:hypothetical protein
MNLHVLVAFLLLLVLVPLFAALAVAWQEMKSPPTQLPTQVRERSRDGERRRFVPTQASRWSPLTLEGLSTIFRRKSVNSCLIRSGKPEVGVVPAPRALYEALHGGFAVSPQTSRDARFLRQIPAPQRHSSKA